MRHTLDAPAILLLCALSATACSKEPEDNNTPAKDMGQRADMAMTTPAEDMGSDMTGAADMADMTGEGGLEIPQGCNPIAFEQDCLFPYPSNVFLIEDDSMPSKHRVKLTNAAKLKKGKTTPIDFMDYHPVDGFSHHQPIMALFGEVLDEDVLTFHDEDLDATLAPTSATILINAKTGEPVAHWAEVEKNSRKEERRVLAIRTIDNLEPETRYIVAIQKLKNADGEAVAPPQGFAQLRAGEVDGDPVLTPLLARYEADIFPALSEFGVNRDDLQLAWDFTTQSRESVTRDMLHMRADLMAKLKENPPEVTIDKVDTDTGNEEIAVRIEGSIKVPLYLESAEVLAGIHRGDDGLPEANGTLDVPFTLQIPTSAIPESEDFEPARILQYGHGFFGSREEINYGSFMRGYSNENRYITISVDWWGMREEEIGALPAKLTTDPVGALKFLDDVHQGMMNFIALSHAVKTSLKEVDELERFGKLLYDPDKLYYYGISQGHILGTTFLALSPHIDRAVFSVGGAPFSFMMSRSSNFATFLFIIRTTFGDDLDIQKFMTLSQHSFDKIDPSTWAEHVIEDQLPDTPTDRKVLIQFGLWDHSVPSLSSMNLSRMSNIPLLEPSPMSIYGLETVTGEQLGSATVLADFMVPDPAGYEAKQPTQDQIDYTEDVQNVHEGVRHNAKLKEQIELFLQPDGTIVPTCDGPCDPE